MEPFLSENSFQSQFTTEIFYLVETHECFVLGKIFFNRITAIETYKFQTQMVWPNYDSGEH